MMEDKLDHDERLRLECVAQAIAFNASMSSQGIRNVLMYAEAFEAYVRRGGNSARTVANR